MENTSAESQVAVFWEPLYDKASICSLEVHAPSKIYLTINEIQAKYKQIKLSQTQFLDVAHDKIKQYRMPFAMSLSSNQMV